MRLKNETAQKNMKKSYKATCHKVILNSKAFLFSVISTFEESQYIDDM